MPPRRTPEQLERFRESERARQKEYYSKNRMRAKERSLKRNWGLTLDDFNQMLFKQNYECSICESDLNELPLKNIHIDHDHSSGKIRSVLCNKCNQGLGLFRDSPLILKKAAKYLEIHDA